MSRKMADAIKLEDYRPPSYLIDTIHLDFRLDPKETLVTATMAIRRGEEAPIEAPLILDGGNLELTGLKLNGHPLPGTSYEATQDCLEIGAPPAGPFELEVQTRINPDANTALEGLYRSSGTYCTQCEAEGFRRITYFPDRPDVMSVYTTRIEAPKSEVPVLLGNGNLQETGDIPGTGRHYAIWHDPHPKPSYLFALVAGDLACVSSGYITASGKAVDLNIYMEHGKEGACDWAMESLKAAMRWDEERFGREYDLDVFNIVAVSDFNMGAMENKGLNIFNDKYILANPDTATDEDYANIEAVIAHEYFHNWTGNRITCRDWFQLCLKEGLTVFRDQEFSSDMRSRAVKRIADVRLLKSHQFPEDAGPLAHPVRPRQYKEINNFYTATVYEKGAEVVRMLKTLLGDEVFAAGLDLYFTRHDGEATTIEAFLECFETASGTDLKPFALWYEQAGTPVVTMVADYDANEQQVTASFTQEIAPVAGKPSGQPAVIPLRFALVGPDGEDMETGPVTGATVRDDVLVLDEAHQTVTFPGISSPPVLSVLRGFSAPVRLSQNLTADELLFLSHKDSDPFNRWQALQTLILQDLLQLTETIRHGGDEGPDQRIVDAIGAVLIDEALDPAFRAQAICLPSEADIGQEIGRNVDPDAIAAARKTLRRAVCQSHPDQLRSSIAKHSVSGPYSPDASDAGRRALANRTLSYYVLAAHGDEEDILWARFSAANNMTDRIAALTLLVHEGFPAAEEALESYLARHKEDPLALDKWFMTQATAPRATTLGVVRSLVEHPRYDASNPNRVRSLVHAFATGNPTQFARADGHGFRFVAETILDLDRRNPQVASRLLTSFRSWRALERHRSQHARHALLYISSCQELSRDSRDIVDRTLQ